MGVSINGVGARQQYGYFDTHTFIQFSTYAQRALDRVLECSRLLSDSEDPGLVSERPGTGPRALDMVSEGPGVVFEDFEQHNV